jgi:hypothetical protein
MGSPTDDAADVATKGFVVTVLLALLISTAGVVWIDATVPGAWPDLIGPSDEAEGH